MSSKKSKAEIKCPGLTRIWDAERVFGTAVVYIANPNDHFCDQHDFEFNTIVESWPEEVRAVNVLRRHGKRQLERKPKDKLDNELVLIFGARMSAHEALLTLERISEDIRKNGLLIGRNEADRYLSETVSGEIL